MTCFHCIIVDDEPAGRSILRRHANVAPELEIAAECYSAQEAREALNKSQVDILFLDIQMPMETGLELLASLNQKPVTVIVSAHPEFALDAFDLGVRDYLLKPVSPERFRRALDNVLDIAETARSRRLKTPPLALSFSTGYERQLINPRDIVAIESQGNFSMLHFANINILVSESLKSLHLRLAPFGFERVHKSWIANSRRVKSIRTSNVVFDTGLQIPIGRAYQPALFTDRDF